MDKDILTKEKKLSEIQEKISVLAREDYSTRQEIRNLKIDRVLESGILSKIKWEARIENANQSHLYIDAKYYFKDSKKVNICYEPKEIFDLAEGYHDGVNIIPDGSVEFSFNDGELSIYFRSFDTALKYIKEWKLDVSFKKLDNLILELENKLESLKVIREII